MKTYRKRKSAIGDATLREEIDQSISQPPFALAVFELIALFQVAETDRNRNRQQVQQPSGIGVTIS